MLVHARRWIFVCTDCLPCKGYVPPAALVSRRVQTPSMWDSGRWCLVCKPDHEKEEAAGTCGGADAKGGQHEPEYDHRPQPQRRCADVVVLALRQRQGSQQHAAYLRGISVQHPCVAWRMHAWRLAWHPPSGTAIVSRARCTAGARLQQVACATCPHACGMQRGRARAADILNMLACLRSRGPAASVPRGLGMPTRRSAALDP